MTPHQISIIQALRCVQFPAGSQDDKFALAVTATAEKNPAFELSKQQDDFLQDLAVRYRRLLPLGLVMEPKKGFTVLQWMAPELVRSGLIKNEPWVAENATKAIELFPNKSMHVVATFLAALHPYAYDYIKTAPVLALVIGQGKGERGLTKKDYKNISNQWLAKFENGAKLRDVMESAKIPYVLRKISSLALKSSLLESIMCLSTLSHDTLSNFIPAADMQMKWLELITLWQRQMKHRYNDRLCQLEWAVKNFHPRSLANYNADYAALKNNVGVFADYVGHLTTVTENFNQTWTIRTVARECQAWHDQLARANEQQKFFLTNGKEWDEPIAYHPLPTVFDCDGYTLTALRSGKDLFEEGAAMRHCVASYSKSVINGTSRIYSMIETKTQEKIATVEFGTRKFFAGWEEEDEPVRDAMTQFHLIRDKKYIDGWHLTQAKGPCNNMVKSNHLAVISKLKDRINYQVALWKHCKGDMEKFNRELGLERPTYSLAESQLMG